MKKLKADLTNAVEVMEDHHAYQLECVARAMRDNCEAIAIAEARADLVADFIDMDAKHEAVRMATRMCDAMVAATVSFQLAIDCLKIADETKTRIARMNACDEAARLVIKGGFMNHMAGERITEAAEYEAGR